MSWRSDNPLWPVSVRETTGFVYHYTDPRGLQGILEHGVLWCTEAASLNDLDEVARGWALVWEWLDRQNDSESLNALRAAMNPNPEGGHEVFVLSASTSEDDANQWRLYGGRGVGYCVALDAAAPLAVVANGKTRDAAPETKFGIPFTDPFSVSPWMHVLYEASGAIKALDELLTLVGINLRRLQHSTRGPDEYELELQEFQANCYEAVAAIAHLIKAPGFMGESEVRAVATSIFGEGHVKHRPGAYGMTGYVELTERGMSPADRVVRGTTRAPIVGVRLGPLLRADHADGVKRALRINGYREASKAVSASDLKLR